ncbi:hypothetical protein LB534_09855 [Mesorhizobium sp. CA18]|uniref:hypothetical protein n=1 Tax=unclassified Mesorhizobium TaxID=325217 RepID=UPI001CCF3A1D|nr:MULTISPECIES: hypothetical protein [unclassified Mesorhizobium]MBZ9733910.1 hypothetical protein [Mesorhizobium sp. CA9]MBZ9825584.1 hypothetical protein [Mesorhizobium sp. CA18]MBZ9832008.1 hypothetical protein [Mesorhizobium sp. CA2]MBZ9837008.1 hypothetical protein [Mesorhizobium sp. CA3]MBZ9875085.1 hypothetical protein [Mesorhizobium sp. Ca11]
MTVGIATASVCIVLAAIMGWQLSSQHIQYDKQADHYAEDFASHSNEEILKSCGATAGLDLVKCLRQELEAERDTKRGEADLAAQQKVAKWSLGAFIISGLSLLFTAGGVWLVYLNLGEARKVTAQSVTANEHAVRSSAHAHRMAQLGYREARAANAIAKDASEKELRAYLAVAPKGVNQLIGTQDVMGHIEVRNVGRLPAHKVVIHVRMGLFNGRILDLAELPVVNDLTDSELAPVDRVVQPGDNPAQGSKDRQPLVFITPDNWEFVYVWG